MRPPAVGQGVHQDVDGAEVFLHLVRALLHGPVLVAGVALVGAHLLRHVGVRVEHRVQRVHLRELHQAAQTQGRASPPPVPSQLSSTALLLSTHYGGYPILEGGN